MPKRWPTYARKKKREYNCSKIVARVYAGTAESLLRKVRHGTITRGINRLTKTVYFPGNISITAWVEHDRSGFIIKEKSGGAKRKKKKDISEYLEVRITRVNKPDQKDILSCVTFFSIQHDRIPKREFESWKGESRQLPVIVEEGYHEKRFTQYDSYVKWRDAKYTRVSQPDPLLYTLIPIIRDEVPFNYELFHTGDIGPSEDWKATDDPDIRYREWKPVRDPLADPSLPARRLIWGGYAYPQYEYGIVRDHFFELSRAELKENISYNEFLLWPDEMPSKSFRQGINYSCDYIKKRGSGGTWVGYTKHDADNVIPDGIGGYGMNRSTAYDGIIKYRTYDERYSFGYAVENNNSGEESALDVDSIFTVNTVKITKSGYVGRGGIGGLNVHYYALYGDNLIDSNGDGFYDNWETRPVMYGFQPIAAFDWDNWTRGKAETDPDYPPFEPMNHDYPPSTNWPCYPNAYREKHSYISKFNVPLHSYTFTFIDPPWPPNVAEYKSRTSERRFDKEIVTEIEYAFIPSWATEAYKSFTLTNYSGFIFISIGDDMPDAHVEEIPPEERFCWATGTYDAEIYDDTNTNCLLGHEARQFGQKYFYGVSIAAAFYKTRYIYEVKGPEPIPEDYTYSLLNSEFSSANGWGMVTYNDSGDVSTFYDPKFKTSEELDFALVALAEYWAETVLTTRFEELLDDNYKYNDFCDEIYKVELAVYKDKQFGV